MITKRNIIPKAGGKNCFRDYCCYRSIRIDQNLRGAPAGKILPMCRKGRKGRIGRYDTAEFSFRYFLIYKHYRSIIYFHCVSNTIERVESKHIIS